MTAETLKPFITPNVDFPSAHATKRRPFSSNLVAIGLAATCITLAIIMISTAIWNTIRIAELENKLKTLNNVVEDINKRLGINDVDEMNTFEKEYTNALIDDSTSIDSVNGDEDDYDVDDDDDDEDDEFLEEDYEEMIKKYQDYELENGGDYGSDVSDDDKLYDDFEKYKDSKKKGSSKSPRDKRAIVNASNGLPVYEASFLEKLNKTEGNAPAMELVKPSQTSVQNEQHRSRKPVMRYDWSDWSDRLTQNAKKNDEVHKHGDNYKRYVVGEKRDERRHSPLRHHGHNRRRKFPMIKSGDSLISAKSTADSSSTSLRSAAHFHLDRKVADRHAAIRVDSYSGDMYIGSPSWTNGEQFFNVENGILTAREAGLYYIYAQVCYNNSHDQNGFVIFHGHKPYLQCLNTIPTNMPFKIHTCHTSGLIYLGENETIHLRDFHSDRNAILKDTNNRSYFGLIKI